jgi:hypothetical protein
MQDQYKLIGSLSGELLEQERVTRRFLQRMPGWILKADPGEAVVAI